MTIEEIRELLQLIGAFGVGGLIAGGLVFYLLKSFIPSYLGEKAKNLATREDIASINGEIERVKTQYAILIEELRAKHQLRLAAVESRLKVHQEAFTLWRELLASAHHDNVGDVVQKCQSWWERNCLYLEPAVREAFSDAYFAAPLHKRLVEGGISELENIQSNWKRIVRAGELIVEAVQLPGLTTAERTELAKLAQPQE